VIQDISYEGARIAIFDPIDIPDKIKLCIPEKNLMMRANARWRRDNETGLSFFKPQPGIISKSLPRCSVPMPR
jgi:hypothetical protein